MLEHLDDPLPLRPATPQQRQAVLARGRMLRRRRRNRVAALALAVPAAAVAAAGVRIWAPETPTPISPAVSASPSVEATATAGPGRGNTIFLGTDPAVLVTFDLPPGWQVDENGITRSGSDPLYGYVFYDVENVYADGCRWQLVKPAPGPTVDDLVAAYQQVPGYQGPPRPVTVDGHPGQQIRHTVPDYDESTCQDGHFGLIYEDNNLSSDNAPSLWAQTPGQQNTVTILDVDGTRLVVAAGNPPDIPTQDREALNAILDTIKIN